MCHHFIVLDSGKLMQDSCINLRLTIENLRLAVYWIVELLMRVWSMNKNRLALTVKFCSTQAVKCSLTGLEDVNVATELVYSVLESAVLGKTCHATIDKR